MQTPCEKRNNLNFSSKSNLFTSSGNVNDFFLKENYMSPFDFSLNKYILTSYKRPLPRDSTTHKNKYQFSNCSIKFQKENCKEIHKLDVKKSSFKINNVNFNIKLSYMK
jgi:hypothetical protein